VIATARYLFQAAFASQLSANEVTRLMGLVLRRDFLPLGDCRRRPDAGQPVGPVGGHARGESR